MYSKAAGDVKDGALRTEFSLKADEYFAKAGIKQPSEAKAEEIQAISKLDARLIDEKLNRASEELEMKLISESYEMLMESLMGRIKSKYAQLDWQGIQERASDMMIEEASGKGVDELLNDELMDKMKNKVFRIVKEEIEAGKYALKPGR
jgi:hypothetical protein